MSELTEFLLARIAEDEAVAQAAATVPLVSDDEPWALEVDSGDRIYGATGCVIASPARVLAERAAKRSIVERFVQHAETEETYDDHNAGWAAQGLYEAILDLASVYADHPEFQEEWKP